MIKASEARHLYDGSLQDWKNGDTEQSFVNILLTNRAGQGSNYCDISEKEYPNLYHWIDKDGYWAVKDMGYTLELKEGYWRISWRELKEDEED